MDTRKTDLRRTLELGAEVHEAPPKKRPARLRAPPELPLPLYRAAVKKMAETDVAHTSSSTADIDSAIITRIKKCLDRANHPSTPEAEARAALHLGSRLMGQYNVSQAEVLAHEPNTGQQQYAGQSVVSIVRCDGNPHKLVRQQSHVGNLGGAMQIFFDCKSYSTGAQSSVDFTFYGIAQNSKAAAMSFEMAYNLIAEWARPYKGVRSRNSYCNGLCDELLRAAKVEKVKEEAQAEKAESDAIAARTQQEEADRAAQIALLAPTAEHLRTTPLIKPGPVGSTVGTQSSAAGSPEDSKIAITPNGCDESDDFDLFDAPGLDDDDMEEVEEGCIDPDFDVKDEGSLDIFTDLDAAIDKLIKPEPQSPAASLEAAVASVPAATQDKSDTMLLDEAKREEAGMDVDFESKWASRGQLVMFRKTATKIADEYLDGMGIKLRKPRAGRIVFQDQAAYKQGRKDSKNIDVHRKRISN
ncbi:hypothetical protein JX265_013681 [Neoarthrinium moseri]|uniref:DUF2786 domain-containing protein n=1 Tax=Neoarthrinium moseri TaxID=1658444 RepID=A0A9P9W822_9PEZI|nr:hypothetical protein JX266_014131 [Neoarthrinium moseri]KAI1849031.1 hypothetical protein JX265_013681 [Neoarthrinium moseri]